MKPKNNCPLPARVFFQLSVCLAMLAGCASPRPLLLPITGQPAVEATLYPGKPSAATIETATAAPTQAKDLFIVSAAEKSTGEVVTITPTYAAPEASEPVIFTGFSSSVIQKCGHGEVVAADGHILRATPRITQNNSNYLERLPLGSLVDVIDCRLWTDADGVSWLAVRTAEMKLGWMFLQADKIVFTIYPVPLEVPHAITGLPSGARVAYVPPSNCQHGTVSTEAVATSIGIDLMPVIGDLKGLTEATTGCDMVTGESLGDWRWLGLLGLVGLSEVAMLRHADEAADASRLASDAYLAGNLAGGLSYSDEAVLALLRNADTTAEFRAGLSHLDEVGDFNASGLRTFDDGAQLSDEAIRALASFEQPCSFSADTLIATPGGLMPIAQIEPGNLVLGFDQSNRSQGYFPVTAVAYHTDPLILTLELGGETINTTPEHPFYTTDGWVEAGNLRAGDWVLSAKGAGQVLRKTVTHVVEGMYNLTVAQAHTFYVGQQSWLVHNACSRVLRNNLQSSLPDWAHSGDIEWQAHHIIPGEWENHAYFDRIGASRWDIDGAQNGIALPRLDEDATQLGMPAHRGSHGSYSSYVRSELDRLENAALREGWNETRCLSELDGLIKSLRQYILSGSIRLN